MPQSTLPFSAGQSAAGKACVYHTTACESGSQAKIHKVIKKKNMYIGVLNYKESKYHDRKGKRVPDDL